MRGARDLVVAGGVRPLGLLPPPDASQDRPWRLSTRGAGMLTVMLALATVQLQNGSTSSGRELFCNVG